MKLVKKFLYFLYMIIVCLAFLEVGIRIWGYSEHYIYEPIYKPFNQSKEIPYVHKPCLKNARARGNALINTDVLGLRSLKSCQEYGVKRPNEVRIAIVGDSVTFGEGIERTSDTYPVLLEDILAKGLKPRKVQVFNFAVSAYSVKEMAATLKYRMLKVQPDLVIMAIIPQDFDLSRTGTIDQWGYTVHSCNKGIWRYLDPVRNILRRFHLIYLVRDIYYRFTRQSSSAGGMCSAQGQLPSSYKYVKEFVDVAKGHHIKSLIVLLPAIGCDFPRPFLKQMEKDHILFLDLTWLKDEIPASKFKASSFDPHPSVTVHKMIAQEIAQFLLSKKDLFFPG